MPDFAAGDVTYTLINARKKGDSRAHNRVKLEFGDGTITYPAGGIPITKGKLGCPVIVESMAVVDKGTSGYNFMYDQSTEKLVVFRTGVANAVEVEVSTVAIAAQAIEVEAIGW